MKRPNAGPLVVPIQRARREGIRVLLQATFRRNAPNSVRACGKYIQRSASVRLGVLTVLI